jgi:subtilisin family serine protease
MLAIGATFLTVAATGSAAVPRSDAHPVVGRGVVSELAREGQARVIVAFRVEQPTGLRRLAGIVRETSAIRDRVLKRLGSGNGFVPAARWDAVAAMPGLVTAPGLRRLSSDPEVSHIDLDTGGRATDNESLPLIGGDIAHSQGLTGKGVTVAVLDSGVDETHPDLASSLVAEHCFVVPNGCPNGSAEQDGPGSARDDNGHGTNVAGIIASDGTISPVGVAPDASLVAVRVLESTGRFQTSSQVISALNWIALNHPEVRVVNMSLGTTQLFAGTCDGASAGTLAFASVVSTLRARGVTVVASSGNSASASTMAAPACISGVVAVGAVYDAGVGGVTFPGVCTDAQTATDQVTCFSNGGSALDLLAPGAVITSTGRGGGISTYIGTSQASPHVAGATALLLQRDSSLSPDAIESLLKSTGAPITDGRNSITTPRVNVAAALAQLQPQPPAPSPPDQTRPTVRALAGSYHPGKRTQLRFTMRDDSSEARVVEKVYAANGRVYKTYRSGFTDTDRGTAFFYPWAAPPRARGTLKHCARAWDRAGNVSVLSCARLRQR